MRGHSGLPPETPRIQNLVQRRLRARRADVNEILPALAAIGINVFVGAYTASRQHPLYDMDEGHKYVTNRTPFEPAEIALVVVSDTTASHLVRRPAEIADALLGKAKSRFRFLLGGSWTNSIAASGLSHYMGQNANHVKACSLSQTLSIRAQGRTY